jgi:hypothetical protein
MGKFGIYGLLHHGGHLFEVMAPMEQHGIYGLPHHGCRLFEVMAPMGKHGIYGVFHHGCHLFEVMAPMGKHGIYGVFPPRMPSVRGDGIYGGIWHLWVRRRDRVRVTQRCQAGETQKRLLRPLRTADHNPR